MQWRSGGSPANNCDRSSIAADRLDTVAWSALRAYGGQKLPLFLSGSFKYKRMKFSQCLHLLPALLGNLGYVTWRLNVPVHVQVEKLCGGDYKGLAMAEGCLMGHHYRNIDTSCTGQALPKYCTKTTETLETQNGANSRVK